MLKPYEHHQKVKDTIQQFRQQHHAFKEETIKKDVAFKKETYEKIQSLIKQPSIANMMEALSRIRSIQGYEDVDSLSTFAIKKLSELKDIQKRKFIKIGIISTVIASVIAMTSYILFMTLPLNEIIQDGARYLKVDQSYHLIEYIGEDKEEFKMPNGLRGLPITTIKERAFYKDSPQHVRLGYFVETIENESFFDSNLKTITIQPRVKVIGQRAFSKTKLETLVLPNSLEDISSLLLEDTITIKHLSIPFIGQTPSSYNHLHYLLGENSRFGTFNLETVYVNQQDIIKENTFSSMNIKHLSLGSFTQEIELNALSLIQGIQKLDLPFIGLSREDETYYHLGYAFGAMALSEQDNVLPSTLKHIKISDDEQIEPFALSQLQYVETISLIGNTKRLSGYGITQTPLLSKVFLSKNIEYVGPFGIYQVGEPIIHLEHSSVPTQWSTNWNVDDLDIIMGATLDD